MTNICVVTLKARAYYSIVNRLRKANLSFVSLVPGSADFHCDLILTTRREAPSFGPRAMVVEELDERPLILRGQILSRVDSGRGTVLVGIDPGTRIGMAAYYGDAQLGFATFGSIEGLCEVIATLVRKVAGKESLLRIGNGNPALATRLGAVLSELVPGAAIEVVDEAGTSSRRTRIRGIQGDQMAAAKIALRKGSPLKQTPRTR
jgi:hypothetical protein